MQCQPGMIPSHYLNRERKMRTKFFCTNFLNTARGPGHPGKIPGTSRIPLFETQGRQSFEGGHEVFGHHPFAWKTPIPPGGLRTQKLNLCALFSFQIEAALAATLEMSDSNRTILNRYFALGSRLPGTRPKFLDFPENRSRKEQVVFSARAGESQDCLLL